MNFIKFSKKKSEFVYLEYTCDALYDINGVIIKEINKNSDIFLFFNDRRILSKFDFSSKPLRPQIASKLFSPLLNKFGELKVFQENIADLNYLVGIPSVIIKNAYEAVFSIGAKSVDKIKVSKPLEVALYEYILKETKSEIKKEVWLLLGVDGICKAIAPFSFRFGLDSLNVAADFLRRLILSAEKTPKIIFGAGFPEKIEQEILSICENNGIYFVSNTRKNFIASLDILK